MHLKHKKSRLKQNITKHEFKSNTSSTHSIAMENPAYMATEEEIGTRQRKPVTPGERQTLLQRRNEEFSEKRRKTVSKLSEKDTSEMNNDNNDIEPVKHPQVMIKGNMIY